MPKFFIKIFNLSFFLLFFLLFNFKVFASEKIVILGNKNISSQTIKSLAPKSIDRLEPNLINNFQKKLFETGFFENVKMQVKNNNLFITVIENPLINFFFRWY